MALNAMIRVILILGFTLGGSLVLRSYISAVHYDDVMTGNCKINQKNITIFKNGCERDINIFESDITVDCWKILYDVVLTTEEYGYYNMTIFTNEYTSKKDIDEYFIENKYENGLSYECWYEGRITNSPSKVMFEYVNPNINIPISIFLFVAAVVVVIEPLFDA